MADKYDFSGMMLEEDETQPLRSTMEQAAQQDPDSHAKIIELSDKVKASPRIVETDTKPFEDKVKMDKFDFSTMVKSSPGTAQYLSDFDAAAVSHDDTTMLERLESVGKKILPYTSIGMGMKLREISDDIYENPEPYTQGMGTTIVESFKNTIDGYRVKASDNRKVWADQLSNGVPVEGPVGDLIAQREDKNNELQAQLMEQITQRESLIREVTPKDLTLLQEGVRGGVQSFVQMIPSLAIGIATKNPVAALAPLGAQVLGDTYARGRGEGLTPQEATIYAGLQTSIELVTEILPVKSLVALMSAPGMKKVGRNVIDFIVREMGTEQVATLGQSLVDYGYGLDEQLANATSFEDKLAIQGRRQVVTAIATIVAGGGQIGVATAANKVHTAMMSEEELNAAQYREEQLQLNELAKVAAESKTKSRSPAMFKRFMQQAVDGEKKEVFIDPVQATLYLNSLEDGAIAKDPALTSLQTLLKNNESPNG